ncbi:nuclear transport factor 2 family protein [uncultured Paraglaciecola sp.]|uniref:nuclear transport factor 2 family protein n=1 Tax=uncultured Paraglaciecola sp. TaxID=1765024 RepID=UPI002617FB16|nr:nuclear transport factor 2 family protein [uncultured Paraglaciecola sp.]
MHRFILSIAFLLGMSFNSHGKTDELAFEAVETLFASISNVDHQKMRSVVTDSFVLLEHGEVWTIDDLVNVVTASEYVRTNFFSIISFEAMNDAYLVNYWNKAKLDNKKNSKDIIWLESALIKNIDGKWLISQLHTTRLDDKRAPKGVQFIQLKS